MKNSLSSTFKAALREATPKTRLAHFHSRKHKNLLDLGARIYGSIVINRKTVFFSPNNLVVLVNRSEQ